MEKIESIRDFYKRKFDWMPDNIKNDIGHFNVFKHKPLVGDYNKTLPYQKREYYKITLLVDKAVIHYADKMIDIEKPALIFSNPQIPYAWENVNKLQNGYFCIFNQHFFHQFGNLNQYPVFQPTGNHVFELPDEQLETATRIFVRMIEDINSEYVFKYDALRNLVFELLHLAMKMHPIEILAAHKVKSFQRITTLFLELLERQFPIDENHPSVNLRSASDFAHQLNVHTNHLNRAVKDTTQKTTTQIIAERFLQEAKILLKYSNWQVTEIAFALGFTEVTHFHNFFKKYMAMSPLKFRNV